LGLEVVERIFAADDFGAAAAERFAEGIVAEETFEAFGERCLVARRDQDAIHVVFDEVS
jgi:hypothetical protein